MAHSTRGEIRRSQLITTYGPGAVVAVEDESFMVAGIDRWESGPPDLHEPRLERRLRVEGFRIPPASEDRPDIPVVRFPTWAHCPSCRRLARYQELSSLFKNICNGCGVPLVPSRFVICCENGHIDDFPWFNWVHAGSKPTDVATHRMELETGGNTASLRDIRISCSCGKRATLENAFLKNAMRGVTKCSGRRPWLSDFEPDCDQLPRALQRGASNVWFSITHSAISIPPWSEGAFKVLNRHWEMLRHFDDDEALERVLEGMKLAAGTPYNTDDLVRAVRQRQAGETQSDEESPTAFRRDEFQALVNGQAETSRDQEFVAVPSGHIPDTLTPFLTQVMLVKRLREVRALASFSRVNPPSNSPGAPRPPLFSENPGWLPAIEVNGEGVFFVVDDAHLKEWESGQAVQQRVRRIDDNYRARFEAFDATADRSITPRLVLIHTLAHALIAQWSLDSGYPAAALRERLFVADDMAGFLIYTATSDSAGSLGGVVSEAAPDRLDASFHAALDRASWCSADPLCIESGPSGVDGLNLGACHACMLLPEVSCDEMNLLLDRALLVGTPETPSLGFFHKIG